MPPRLHLAELEDQPWLPGLLRDGVRDVLDALLTRQRFYDGVVPAVRALLETTGERTLLDLASGGGGGTRLVAEQLRAQGLPVTVRFTDRHPNADALARVQALGDPDFQYEPVSVDALDGGGDRPGVRTMATAAHHFTPDALRALIGAVVARNVPLAFYDLAASPTLRRLPLPVAVLALAINGVLVALATMAIVPTLRPRRWSRLFVTYLPPLLPLVVAFDGGISALRSYTADELLAIARSAPGADRYHWDAGVAGHAVWMTGWPSNDGQERTA